MLKKITAKNFFNVFHRESLLGLSHLVVFNISSNNISYIHPDFCDFLPSVTKLDLSRNKLKDLFENTDSLGNKRPIGRLTSAFLIPNRYRNTLFAKCKNIRLLNLNNDEIPIFDSDFVQSKSLKKLSFASNEVTSATVEYFLLISQSKKGNFVKFFFFFILKKNFLTNFKQC